MKGFGDNKSLNSDKLNHPKRDKNIVLKNKLDFAQSCLIAGEILQAEKIDRKLQNALLEAVGEKAPGFKPRLEKGTELSALGGVRSELEYLIIPTLALLGSIMMLGM